MNSTAFRTDTYELTMIDAALQNGTAHTPSTFELFARKLPKGRKYGVVGGTNRAIEAVKDFRFTSEQISYLRADGRFSNELITYLENYEFRGKIFGYREGDLYFPNSPVLTLQGTFAECVILETVLLSIMNHDTAVISAAARMVSQARGVPIIEMGSRRTHEESAVAAARVAYIAGFAATSNLEAGERYGVPITGTSAHAFTLLHETEKEAFAAQVKALGVGTTLLVDTYDTPTGIRNAVEVAGVELGGIRIDSGNLADEVREARILLDSLGAVNTKIVVSSDIDEFTIRDIADSPVGGYGAGTRVVTGSGHPTAGFVFKLVEKEVGGVKYPVAKKSADKVSVGGTKIVSRELDENGKILGETFTVGDNEPLSVQKMYVQNGTYEVDNLLRVRGNNVSAMSLLSDDALNVDAGEAVVVTRERVS